MRIIVLFNLKAGVDANAYEDWARHTDIPCARALVSIDDYDVYRNVGLFGSDGRPPYAYTEIIDVFDIDAFGRDVASDRVQKLVEQFESFADNPVFMMTERL